MDHRCVKNGKTTGLLASGLTTRPKAWQQLWLDRHREAMVRRLQGHVMAIVDRLVQEGDINPSLDEAYQSIVSPYSVPVEKVRQLLDSLRSRTPEAFDHFQSALREHGCRNLAITAEDVRKLEAELDLLPVFQRLSLEVGVPGSVAEARRRLQRTYLEAASEVHMLADTSRSADEGLKFVEDVFVDVGLVSSDEVEKLCLKWTGKDGGVEEVLSQAMKARRISLSGLLQANREGEKDPVRVVALGTAGSGKTFTFTQKVTYEWCGGEFWAKIAFLQTLRCRDKSVWQAKTIAELFRLRELGLSSEQEAEAEAFIAQHPEHVALVCDGLDEGHVDEDSFLWRVMNGTSLRGLIVIVTSRPCRAISSLSRSGSVHRHVQLFGFSKEKVDEFVAKYLGDLRGRAMLSQIAREPAITSLMRTPFFALLVCEQFKDSGQLPRRRSDVFSSVTLRLAQRYAQRKGLPANFQCLSKAPAELCLRVLELGKVAFDRLKRKDLSYFKLKDADLSAEAVELGFLEHMQGTSPSVEDQYGFRHLTVQEYLAALYASAEVLKQPGDVIQLVEQLGCGKESGHLNTFWVFVAGFLEFNLHEELLCAVADIDRQIVRMAMHADRGAAGGSDSCARASAASEGQDAVRVNTAEVLRQDKLQEKDRTLPVYRFLLMLQCYEEGATDGLNWTLSPCVQYVLSTLGVCCRCHEFEAWTPSDVGLISRVMEHYGDVLEIVDMEMCFIGHEYSWSRGDGLATLLPGLRACTSLKALNLCWNYLSEKHMADVGEILAFNRLTLQAVDVSRNCDVGDEGFGLLAKYLERLNNLHRLGLSVLRLTQASAAGLASIISHQPCLVECDISENDFEEAGFIALAPALQTCKHLKKLHLQKTGLAGPSASLSLLSAALADLPQLRDLDLGWNDIRDEGFVLLAPGLQQCTRLHTLRLVGCGLTSDGRTVALLTMVVLCLPHLKRLSVDRNQIGDVGLDWLSIGLEECSQLTHLSLTNIGMTSSQSISTVSRLLQRLGHLTRVTLQDNPFVPTSIRYETMRAAMRGHPPWRLLSVSKGVSEDAARRSKNHRSDVHSPGGAVLTPV